MQKFYLFLVVFPVFNISSFQLNLLRHLLSCYLQYIFVKRICLRQDILFFIHLFYCLNTLGQLTSDKNFYECLSCGFELLSFLEKTFCWMNQAVFHF